MYIKPFINPPWLKRGFILKKKQKKLRLMAISTDGSARFTALSTISRPYVANSKAIE
jgi:hypothetical protein